MIPRVVQGTLSPSPEPVYSDKEGNMKKKKASKKVSRKLRAKKGRGPSKKNKTSKVKKLIKLAKSKKKRR